MSEKTMKKFKKERKERLKGGEKYKTQWFSCQRCGMRFTEAIPKSEGWQPFSLYPCKKCKAEFASFIGYTT